RSKPPQGLCIPRTSQRLSSRVLRATEMLEGGFYRRRNHHRGTHRWVVSIYFCLLYEKKATGDLRMICVPRSLLRSHAAARRHQLVMGALGLGCTCQRILRQNDMRDGILPGVLREKP